MANLHLKDISIEEQQGVEGLGLGGGGNTPYGGKVIDEIHDAIGANEARMLAAMEMDVPTNPEPIGLLGTAAQMSAAADQGNLVHEPQRGLDGWGQVTP